MSCRTKLASCFGGNASGDVSMNTTRTGQKIFLLIVALKAE